MTNWSVTRIETQPPGTSSLVCFSDETATQITLTDLDTNMQSVITLCKKNTDSDPCALLGALATAGYVPNDWTGSCP